MTDCSKGGKVTITFDIKTGWQDGSCRLVLPPGIYQSNDENCISCDNVDDFIYEPLPFELQVGDVFCVQDPIHPNTNLFEIIKIDGDECIYCYIDGDECIYCYIDGDECIYCYKDGRNYLNSRVYPVETAVKHIQKYGNQRKDV